MYRIMAGDKKIGDFENVVFTRKNPRTGSFIPCKRDEADGVFVNNTTYAITNSDEYKEYEHVAIVEVDSAMEQTAEMDYLRIMANLV